MLRALSLQPEYLRNAASEAGAVVDYEHWQMPLGRRFRALKLWFVLRRFGAAGVRAHLRAGIDHRVRVEAWMAGDGRFEVRGTPALSLVCFRLRGAGEAEQRRYLDRLNATGEAFLIHSRLGTEFVIRVACGGSEVSAADVDGLCALMGRVADDMGV